MIEFGREVTNDYESAASREWLITNGIGGYASGTIAGTLTRRYHGLLIATLNPPLERTLLVSKFDETASCRGEDFSLYTNHWGSGDINPAGYQRVERFHLKGTTPTWTYGFADALLEKRVWMQLGANTTYVRYDLLRSNSPVRLHIKATVNYRDHHGNTHMGDLEMRTHPVENGLKVLASDESVPFYLLSAGVEATPQYEWYQDYYLSVEAYRGLDALDNNLYACLFRAELEPGESITLVVSTESDPNLDGKAAYREKQFHESSILSLSERGAQSAELEQLVLAADQFIIDRSIHGNPDGKSIIAGFPWFGDWGRDTMIALPGLTLVTGRAEIARDILKTFSIYVDQGMLPNRFPEVGETPEYNTVDATLWYFEAVRAYWEFSADDDFIHEIYPVLEDIIAWHTRGTRYNIQMDPEDGLLYAGESGVQLTWMDAKVEDWVVTPRVGKPIEINALWLNVLHTMTAFAGRVGASGVMYAEMAARVAENFHRFWNPETNTCFDVIDGPQGDDSSFRPNQLFAVSLPHSALSADQQRAVVDACAAKLLTPHGLRSLSPDEKDFIGNYGGDRYQRDSAYHQGTTWGWLIGPFVQAHLRVYDDPKLAQNYLQPLLQQIITHGVGSISEIFDGDAPFTPRGCIAQAWSVAEVLRAWQLTKNL